MTQIERFKSDQEMTPGDWLEFSRTGKRPERSEYVQARRDALEAAGLEHDDEAPRADVGAWTPDDHLNAIRKDRS